MHAFDLTQMHPYEMTLLSMLFIINVGMLILMVVLGTRGLVRLMPRLEINRFSAQLRVYMMIVALLPYSLALLGFITITAAGLVLYGVSRDHYLVASVGIIVFAVGALGWATLFLWVIILLVRDLYLFCRHSTKQFKILPNSKPTVED